MSLSFAKRPCMIGTGINTRTQMHGDDEVPSADVPLFGIMLNEEEFNEIMDDRFAYRGFFNTRGKVVEPAHKAIGALPILAKYEKSLVTLYLGLNDDAVKLTGKIAKIRLSPKPGGLCEMSMTVQCSPDADTMGQLFANLSKNAHCSARFGKVEQKKKSQPELPLGKAGDEDADHVPGPLDERPAAN